MADIGETLREARMRRRIDMAEVESATKIRAKYLRALENEEWNLLPGSTFVKTFLRTYAEYLELDARALVEEYKQRYERPAHGDAAAFAGLGGPGRRPPRQQQRRRSRGSFGPAAVVLGGLVLVLGALWIVGKWGSKDEPANPRAARTATPTPTPGAAAVQPGSTRNARTRVSLRLEATGDVYVCLVDANGRRLLDGTTMHAGETSSRFVGKRLRANFGTANVRMRVNGKTYRVAASTKPVGYELRPGRRPRRLSDAERPTCT
jgi:transcriptional regulator with XRE-family HTH domain